MGNQRQFRQYDREKIREAVREVRTCNTSVLEASKKYEVPRSTLRRVLKCNLTSPKKMGPPTLLSTSEETMLIVWILELKDRGFPVSPDELCTSVKKMLDKSNRTIKTFVGNRPGYKWVELFEARHPEITIRTTQQLVISRSRITKKKLFGWFDEIQDYLTSQDCFSILRDPSRIFNCDEAAFLLNPKKKKVYVKRGDKTVYQVSGDDKTCLTVLCTVCADGSILPPMVVFKNSRLAPDLIATVPDSWGIRRSPDSGWMTSQTFFEFITNVFYPCLIKNNVKLPIILFLDGHASHMSLELSEFCSEHGIILIAFVPHATHIQQPCDVSLFHPMKVVYKDGVRQWKLDNDEFQVMKKDFATIFDAALKAIPPSVVINGFRACGLYPWDREAIDLKKLTKKSNNWAEDSEDEETAPVEIDESLPSTSLTEHLKFLESRISPTKLNLFKSDIEQDKNDPLYCVWNKIRQDVINSSSMSSSLGNSSSSSNVISNDDLPPTSLDAPLMSLDPNIISDNSHVSTSSPSGLAETSNLIQETILHSPSASSTPLRAYNPENAPKTIPSPFKRILPWPVAKNKVHKGDPKKVKKQLPFTLTSEEWQKHYRKEREEKQKLADELEERKKQRLLKKAENEEACRERKRKRLLQKAENEEIKKKKKKKQEEKNRSKGKARRNEKDLESESESESELEMELGSDSESGLELEKSDDDDFLPLPDLPVTADLLVADEVSTNSMPKKRGTCKRGSPHFSDIEVPSTRTSKCNPPRTFLTALAARNSKRNNENDPKPSVKYEVDDFIFVKLTYNEGSPKPINKYFYAKMEFTVSINGL